MNLLKLQLKIRHDDWPFILQFFAIFFGLSILGYYLFSEGAFHYFLLSITLLFLILTGVHFNNIRKRNLRNLQYKVQALNELSKLLPFRRPLPAMTGWAATPELSLNVYKIIEEKKPTTIVELGSGVSTIISAYSLEKFHPEGRIFSFDHNAAFARKTRTELNYHQLENFAQIHNTSLAEINLNNQTHMWYDIDFTQIEKPIDFLIIDGPPLKTQKNARYPAIPFFYSKLSENAVLIFHDTDRYTESETVKMWLEEFPDFTHSTLRTEKGITIFRRKERS